MKVTLIGCGAIGSGVLELLSTDASIEVIAIVVPDVQDALVLKTRDQWAPSAQIVTNLHAIQNHSGIVVECAGHAAIKEHIIPALQQGIFCVVASIGALAEQGQYEALELAAKQGNTQVQLVSGAIAAIDAISAARWGGLGSVQYIGRKPPLAWEGTPAADQFDLASIQSATIIFSGTAREAAKLYPKNANVAATVALAGLGLDKTQVTLYADPNVKGNQHALEVHGNFGELQMTLTGKPLAANPKTSALTVYSVVRAIAQHAHRVIL